MMSGSLDSVDTDHTPRSVMFNLDPHCLLRLVCQITKGKYDILEDCPFDITRKDSFCLAFYFK